MGDVISLDAVNYKVHEKTRWRNQVWSALKKIRGRKLLSDVVLYLPGENDLDAPKAEAAGVKPWNLIAIERNKGVAARLRSENRIVLKLDLFDAMENWPIDWPVGVVLADLQAPLIDKMCWLGQIWKYHPAFADSALLVNFQRGRETQDNAKFFYKYNELFSRRSALSGKTTIQMLRHSQEWSDDEFIGDLVDQKNDRLNRAALFNISLIGMQNLSKQFAWPCPITRFSVEDPDSNKEPLLGQRQLDTYRSSVVLMDSALYWRIGNGGEYSGVTIRNPNKKITRYLSAARAVRTMQMNGQLRQKRTGGRSPAY